MAYVYRGAGVFGPERKPAVEGDLVLFAPGSAATLRATDGAPLQVLFLAGEPLGEPIVSYGPFVMNTEEEIYQAFEDYRGGRFGAIAGAEERRAATDAARAKSTAEAAR
jgi:redox-sensitive bicupin YhaK (pirin superfamily)